MTNIKKNDKNRKNHQKARLGHITHVLSDFPRSRFIILETDGIEEVNNLMSQVKVKFEGASCELFICNVVLYHLRHEFVPE